MADYDFNRRDHMVERQIAARGIGDAELLHAMREVPREFFVPENLAEFAYDDTPLPIAEGQTISQPYIVAAMIEAAEVEAGDRVLEVGAGSGYAAAVLSRIAGEVFAIERLKGLADAAELRLARLGYGNVTVIAADGSGGLPEEAPFDAILVAARGPDVPEVLKHQLAIGGRLVIPVGGEEVQTLCRITRSGEDEWTSDDLGPVRFVPLIGEHGLAEDGSRAASDHRAARDKPLPVLIAEAAEPLPEIGDADFAAAFDRFAVRGEHNIGQLIRQRFGDEAALIGFGTHAGTVTCASDWDGPTETKRVLPSRRDSHERLCHDTAIPRFLLDLSAHETLRRRLLAPRFERFIGVIYRPETERWSHYSEAVLHRQFDAFVWFDETRALTPLAEEHLPGHVPNTYPFGL